MQRIRTTHCIDCNDFLDESNTVWTGGMTKRNNRCRTCLSKRMSEKRAAREFINPELKERRLLAAKVTEFRKKYGITLEEFNEKLELQLNGCAICKQPFKSTLLRHVDHDHVTGQARDILCNRCNIILGMADDDEEILFACIEYLKRHAKRIAS